MNSKNSLIRGLGIVGLIASVFNCTVGGGIFKLPSSVYQIVGNASPLVYLLCFLVMLSVVTVFVQVGKTTTVTGGPYAYVQPVLGKYAGFICGVLLWCLATFAMASVANAFAGFFVQLIPGFDSALNRSLVLAVSLAALAYFNIYGVKTGSKISIILSIAKILPMLLLVILGIPHLKTEALSSPTPIEWSGMSRAAMILIFAFTGVESALIPSGEIKNPEKILARALYSALFLVLFLYLGLQTVSQSILGSELGQANGSPLAATGEILLGPGGRYFIMIAATLSTLGYLSAITLSLPRNLFAFAQDGYLPKWLGESHPVHATPARAIIVQVSIAWALAISNQFEHLAVLSNLSSILMYSLCAIAAMKLKGGTFLSSVAMPLIALVSMSFLLTSVTQAEWMSVLGLLAISSVVYWRIKHKASLIS